MLVLAVVYLGRVSSWDELTAAIATVDGAALVVLAVLALGNVVTYWLVLAAALPGLGATRAGLVQLPATALSNLVPAGGAFGTSFTFVALRRWGFGTDQVAAAALITGIAGTAAKLAAPLTVLLIVVPTGGDAGAVVTAAAAGLGLASMVAALVALLRSERRVVALGATIGRVLGAVTPRWGGSVKWATAAARFHQRVRDLLARRWLAIVSATVLSHVALFVLFVACIRAVGLHRDGIGVTDALAVFAAARVVALVPLTPGSIGLIEVMLTAALTAAGGDGDRVVAGVLVYRTATYALPTLLGAGLLMGWNLVRRRERPGGALEPPSREGPLVVDLDGTLVPVTTRTLMLGRLALRRPLALVEYRRLRRRDRLASKWFLWDTVGLDAAALPVRTELLDWLAAQRRLGRRLYLASGAPTPIVEAFLERYPIFVSGWGSGRDRHLVGDRKAALLTERFGTGGFDYVGDAQEDVAVWQAAGRAFVCPGARRVVRRARRAVAEVHALRCRQLGPLRMPALLVRALRRPYPVAELTRPEVATAEPDGV